MGRKSRNKKGRRKQGASGAKGNAGARPPVSDRRALEKTMSDLHRLLAEQSFADIDEANRFMADLVAKSGGRVPNLPARTPLEEAQDVMYEAWDARGLQRVKLARKALEISPDCADAYVLLAKETARSLEQARDLYARAVAARERALGRANGPRRSHCA